MSNYKHLKKMFLYRGYNKKIIKLILLIVVTFIVEISIFPYLTKNILDVQIPNANIKSVIILSVIYIITTAFSCYLVLKFCILRLDLRRLIENDLRQDIFDKLQKVKVPFYDKNTTGTILQFLSNDSDNASNLFPRIIVEMLVMGIGRMFVLSILLLLINFKIGIGIVVIYVAGILVVGLGNRKTTKLLNEIRKIDIDIFNIMNEGISGFTTVKALGLEKVELDKLERKLDNYNILENNLNKIISKYNVLFQTICSFQTVWLILQGTLGLLDGIITYGILMIIIDWSNSIKLESKFIIRHLADFNKSYISFLKILEFLSKEEIEDLESGKSLDSINKIEFKNVSFSYNNSKEVINNFNLEANKEEQIAIVGKTGSGKSTIVNMICRFYDSTKGEILVNDVNIKEYNLKALRSRIGYVMQDVTILKHTIIDNIRYVNSSIALEEIQDIFKQLNLHDRIMSLEDKYETNIYDNPDILSKGEKQLINFARIMACKPDVIILDEVTSSLSYASEMLLKNAMNKIIKGKICFIIAHRLSTISQCDKILVMKEGGIIEKGTHKELIEKKRRIL